MWSSGMSGESGRTVGQGTLHPEVNLFWEGTFLEGSMLTQFESEPKFKDLEKGEKLIESLVKSY